MADLSKQFVTHQVENQPPPLWPYNTWTTDLALQETMKREGAGWATDMLKHCGEVAGNEFHQLGFTANENKPKLKHFDRYGNRVDEVEFHPAYHRLMELSIGLGMTSYPWRNAKQVGAHVARMALSYQLAQGDLGTGCPCTMTYACVPSLRHSPKLAEDWLPKILEPQYDPRCIPAAQKKGLTIGMGMTEKQGGSDVRANSTKAYPLGERGNGQPYQLVGHKWFFSAPMCDAFLVLAYEEAGLSCFLLPKWTPDGQRNAIRIQRLKDKLGDWSNASSEVELSGALAFMVGDPARGVATILEMVALTRQDCMIGSSALMRQALVQAVHHCRHRTAFGKRLIEQPLMKNVLGDLALESEAHLALSARIARAIDGSGRDAHEAAFARIGTAIGKYWVCKRCIPFANEAQECLGGAGYVEENNLARLYRQAPLNSIWEGSGNIQCLDVLRALAKEPGTRTALFDELNRGKGGNRHLDAELNELPKLLEDAGTLEVRSRAVVERLAVALEASLLVQAGNTHVSDTWCESRLAGAHGQTFGTLSHRAPLDRLIERALP